MAATGVSFYRKQASRMACWKHINIQHQQFQHLAQIAKSLCMLHSVPADLPVGQKLPTCICMLQMPKLVPLEWAAVHQVMSSHKVLMSTSPDAWHALVGVWSAMSAHCTPDELLSHIEQLALALSSKAALPGWTKVDFPAGLMMSMALLTTRYPNQAATMFLCISGDSCKLNLSCFECCRIGCMPDHAFVKAVARLRSSCCCIKASQWTQSVHCNTLNNLLGEIVMLAAAIPMSASLAE